MNKREALLKRFDELHSVESVRAIYRDAPDDAILRAIKRAEEQRAFVRRHGVVASGGVPRFVPVNS